LSSTKDTGSYKVRIEDNGIGIAPGDREKVFLPFTRIYGRKYPGAGLGLTIARQIIENYGGSVTVEHSVENAAQGVAFVFTLPEA
jgi:signal transduction histidine kinase